MSSITAEMNEHINYGWGELDNQGLSASVSLPLDRVQALRSESFGAEGSS